MSDQRNNNQREVNGAQTPKAATGMTAEKFEHLKKMAPPVYSISGYMPTTGTWKLTPEQIKSIVARIAKGFLSDISDVTLDVNHKNGRVAALVWIPSDSKHLRDTTTLSEISAIRKPIVRYSSELKEFMDKFCANDCKRTVNEESGLPVVGIEVLLERFLRIEFDENGEQFAREFGTGKFKTKLTLFAHFVKGDNSEFGKLRYIQVEKSIKSDFDRFEPKPKKSFNV